MPKRVTPVQRVVRLVAAAVALVVVLLLVSAVAYAIARPSGDEVARRVEVGGRDVGGMDRGELAAAVRDLNGRYRRSTVRIDGPPKRFTVPAEAIGLAVDEKATVE